tara:strand:+ start:223 stop:813 length:591 start_codon:yes stop_codon:yes gene_type:complete
MSRFDRRLGTGPYAKSNASSTRRKFSPRPGTANCKLPTRNDVIMSINKTNSNVKNNTGINSANNSISSMIDEVSEKNERIMNKIKQSKSASERILLNHELRLNTIELSVDCLNNMKTCEMDNKNNEENNNLQEEKIKTLEKTVSELSDKLIVLTQMIESKNDQKKESITMDISDIVEKKVNKNETEEVLNDGPTFE